MKTSPTDPAAAAERPSKTQLKKAMHELQELGEALLDLPPAALQALALPETLQIALRDLQRVRSHEGRRRQLQYVGKLMRGLDAEPLREAVARQRLGPARAAHQLHLVEHWRERLLAGDAALTDWLAAHPDSDAQALRALIRQARRDDETAAAAAKAGQAVRKGRAYRELYQVLAAHLDTAAPAATETPDAR